MKKNQKISSEQQIAPKILSPSQSNLAVHEPRFELALRMIKNHKRIYNFLIILCYSLITLGATTYLTYFFKKTQNIKIVSDLQKNPRLFKVEKAMTNPRINLQHDDDNIYKIKAKKAIHDANQEVILEEVFAEGKIGRISAGALKIEDEGNHLIFSKNPVLILNQTDQ